MMTQKGFTGHSDHESNARPRGGENFLCDKPHNSLTCAEDRTYNIYDFHATIKPCRQMAHM